MAGGKNKEFLEDPIRFFQQNALKTADNLRPELGLQEIDLVQTGPFITIQDYRKRSHGSGAVPIRAYFLPAEVDSVVALHLEQKADFFFTADLSGCMVAIHGANAWDPVVEHMNAYSDVTGESIERYCAELRSEDYPFCRIIRNGQGVDDGIQYFYDRFAAVMGILNEEQGWQFYFKPDLDAPDYLILEA